MNRFEFAAYLRHTLIPDARAAESDTAEDFETALQFITDDVEILHDASKALLAASAHAPAGSNAATLCQNSAAEIDAAIGGVKPAPVSPVAPRRCLDLNPRLHD